ncbi:LacI family DNA-binding transcriptional regulator [uncultured Tateyamaria sp.]|uniref:LacI family DNA-binding transcriptional regulator n=1 Tax=uncultured Tateyamaria sp. TaxID=455651 RepID=UPI00263726CE|nr:LacI family DNA-binding transcriptional regulator [uncultured Tateyamaria sp.]
MTEKIRRTTLADVARAANVAKSTASLAFSAPQRVAPKTVTRIRQAATELGFSPNPIARSLKSQSSAMIGLLIVDMHNPLNSEVLTQAQQTAAETDNLLLTATSNGDATKELTILRQFERLNVKGVILTSAGHSKEHLEQLKALSIEIVTLDLKLPGLGCDHVGLDNATATRILCEHLIEQGHERIAYVSGERDIYTAARRLEGYERAMSDAGLSVPDENVVHADFAGKRALAMTRSLLSRQIRPSAIIAANNLICAGVIEAVWDAGLSCPDDISIVSVDAAPWPKFMSPQITYAEQPLSKMAELATKWIVDRGERPEEDKGPRLSELKPRLITGNSVMTLSGNT